MKGADMEFGEKLKKLRKAKGLTQKQVAKELGFTDRAYASYEQDNIRPRKRETYDKLAEVLGCDVNYLLVEDSPHDYRLGYGLIALGALMMGPPAWVTLAAGTVVGATYKGNKATKVSVPGDSETTKMLELFRKKQDLFQATAMGIIVKALTAKNIVFRIGNKSMLSELRIQPKEFITIEGQSIESWWFDFFSSKDADPHELSNEQKVLQARALFTPFSAVNADPNRKVSIVVDDKDLFDELSKMKGNNSYRGLITAILIDADKVEIEREEPLSFFETDEKEDKLSII